MNVLHYAGVQENKSSGVSVIVPEIINAQAGQMNVCFYNYGKSSFAINDNVLVMSNVHDDDYHTFPAPFNKPDIVVFHSPFGIRKSVRVADMLRKENIPYVIVPHGCFSTGALAKKRLKKWFAMRFCFKKMFDNAAAVQFLSRGEQAASVYREKGVVVPNGVSFSETACRQTQENRVKISFIGRKDIYHKGLDLLLDACASVRDDLKKKGAIVCLYGPYMGDGGESFKKLLWEKDVEDVVFDCPPVFDEEKARVLLETDVFVLTSRFEGLPGAVLEAWAYGCPTLLTPGSNMAEEAAENNCGWKTENTVLGIASALLSVCGSKDEIRRKSEAASSYVRKKYSWANVAKQYLGEYRKIVERV